MFSQHKYPDCRLLYKTADSTIPMDLHMEVLSASPFFDTFFKWNESIPVKVNKRYINQYTINMPFDISLVEFCIKLLYEPAHIKELANIDSELYSDILIIIDFLQLDNNIYKQIIELFMEIIVNDDSKCFGCIVAICNSNIEVDRKKHFIARYIYLLTEEEKSCIDKEYIPKNVYYGESFIDNNGNLIICGNNNKFNYNGQIIYTSCCYSGYEPVFGLIGNDLDCFTINLIIFDENITYMYNGDEYTQKVTHEPYNSLCCIRVHNLKNNIYKPTVTGYPVFEFILTPKKTENPN